MERFATFLIVICFILAVGFLIIGFVEAINNPKIAFYPICGGIAGAIFWSCVATIINLQLSNIAALKSMLYQSAVNAKKDIKIIECKNCHKKYESSLTSCPHCGNKT